MTDFRGLARPVAETVEPRKPSDSEKEGHAEKAESGGFI